MKFEALTFESQQAAREVLGDILRIQSQQILDFPESTVQFLGHRVREAFAALESVEAVNLDSDREYGRVGSSSSEWQSSFPVASQSTSDD